MKVLKKIVGCCENCGSPFPPDQTVYVLMRPAMCGLLVVFGGSVVICAECSKTHPSWKYQEQGEDWCRDRRIIRPCRGCGLMLSITADCLISRREYCSTGCSQRSRRAMMRIKKRNCEICNLEFKAARKDARFCSDVCRQKHHRQNVTNNQTSGKSAI